MNGGRLLVLFFWTVFCGAVFAGADAVNRYQHDVFKVSIDKQHEMVRPGGESAVALRFSLKDNWHFYASPKTAPGGMNLKIKPAAQGHITFSAPVYPRSQSYFDKLSNTTLDVFSDDFDIFIPFSIAPDASGRLAVEVAFDGAVCSQQQCRLFDGRLTEQIAVDAAADMNEARFELPQTGGSFAGKIPPAQGADLSALFAVALAFLAGLSLNIMPCVWPVLPLIVMRIVQQTRQSKTKTIATGLAFCFGIVLFFAALAAVNIVLQLFYGTVLQWGDQFRSPAFVMAMSLLLVVLALFMFDVFTITIPASLSNKAGSGAGFTGAVGMGFLAAVLSTPCSFAILATAFAWAQAQKLPLATASILMIGIGMAAPYALLTSTPALLNHLPKGGKWMEIFKQTVGFVLLIIAVKLITALPQLRRAGVLYFSVVISFCIWMWAGWVDFNTKIGRKAVIRFLAIFLAVASGWAFLKGPAESLIQWSKYDSGKIKKALQLNRPVLIKFTADWCLSCQLVEKTVYARKDIAELIKDKDVLAIKADTTVADYPATLDLKNMYNEPGVPVSILLLPGGAESVRWRGIAFAEQLKKQLERLPEK